MLENYAITAVRSLRADKLYAAITILGLSAGLAACILLLLFVRHELSYDCWLPDIDRLYRVHFAATDIPGRGDMTATMTPGPARAAMEAYFPEVEAATRLYPRELVVQRDSERFYETMVFADENAFDLFPLPLARGKAGGALSDNANLLLSETMATKYFGDRSPVGETVTVCCLRDQRVELRVVGVFRDLPETTHLAIDFLTRLDPERFDDRFRFDDWGSSNHFTYLRLRRNVSADRVRGRFPAFFRHYAPVINGDNPGLDLASRLRFDIMPVADIHLHAARFANIPFDLKQQGDIATVQTFAAIALLILVIAAINFTNLATARSTRRAREIALRKVVGARRSQIVMQFLGESVLTALVALVLALALVELALPAYASLVDRHLELSYRDGGLVFSTVAGTVLLGLGGGLYPAIYLSRFRPARILKANQSSPASGSGRLRLALVFLQFAISIALVICTAVVYRQAHFAQTMNVGYDKEGLLVLRGLHREGAKENADALAETLRGHPAVVSVSRSTMVPTDVGDRNSFVVRFGQPDGEAPVLIAREDIDFGYFETFGIRPLAGRTLQRDIAGDATDVYDRHVRQIPILVNESGARHVGFAGAQQAVDQTVQLVWLEDRRVEATIVGVVPDTQFRSARFSILPTLYVWGGETMSSMTVRFRATDVRGFVGEVEGIWRQLIADVPFFPELLTDRVRAQYRDEERWATMFAVFSALAIAIACLGLYGLSSFAAARRTKEIGLRKVMGASVFAIVRLLMWQFSRPVLAANLAAWPVAYLLMRRWLDGFHYRIDLSPLFFLGASAAALAISWLTVGTHARRAAATHPAHALRYE